MGRNLDGGHYFLTVLAPVLAGNRIDPEIGRTRSHRHLLAQELAMLPTGRQTEESDPAAPRAPFARNTLTHTARFVIIDQPNFNGRLAADTLLATARKIDPLQAQTVDRLSRPYLLFAVDADAAGEDDEAALRAYTRALWETMRAELTAVFSHCVGFEAVADAESFHVYIRRHQIETSLPFNDYWAHSWKPPPSTLPLNAFLQGGRMAVWLGGIWLGLLAVSTVFVVFAPGGGATRLLTIASAWTFVLLLLAVGGLALFAYHTYRSVAASAAKRLPTAPGSDLPSILKALMAQQNFTRFAIEAQGVEDAELHARFGAFMTALEAAEAGPQVPAMAGECHGPQLEWPR